MKSKEEDLFGRCSSSCFRKLNNQEFEGVRKKFIRQNKVTRHKQ